MQSQAPIALLQDTSNALPHVHTPTIPTTPLSNPPYFLPLPLTAASSLTSIFLLIFSLATPAFMCSLFSSSPILSYVTTWNPTTCFPVLLSSVNTFSTKRNSGSSGEFATISDTGTMRPERERYFWDAGI